MARDFKSVGETQTARRFQKDVNEIPIGIKTPLELGEGHDGLFAMHLNLRDQVADNLRNLILTNHGERLGLYDFGANLRELTLESGQDDFEIEAISRIKTAVTKYMSYIDLETFQSSIERDLEADLTKVRIVIAYSVPKLGITRGLIETNIFVAG